MKRQQFLATAIVLLAGLAAADPYTPARGTPTRQAILDAVRPLAENDLGAPVEFVVNTMQVDGDRGFVMLDAQRPGGAPIDMTRIPLVVRDGESPDMIDGASVVAFVMRPRQGPWQVDAYAVGATDVWWTGDPYCRHYASVLPAQACP